MFKTRRCLDVATILKRRFCLFPTSFTNLSTSVLKLAVVRQPAFHSAYSEKGHSPLGIRVPVIRPFFFDLTEEDTDIWRNAPSGSEENAFF